MFKLVSRNVTVDGRGLFNPVRKNHDKAWLEHHVVAHVLIIALEN